MGVKGSGYQERNELVVLVLDDQQQPYPDGLAIRFDHTLVGGSAIFSGQPDVAGSCVAANGCVTALTASPVDKPDSAGLASVSLTSGTLAGPLDVLASVSVAGVPRSFRFPKIQVIGAKASGLDFAIDCSPRNVPALAETDCSTSFVDQTITCVARMKDRFGNLFALPTPVMFRSEASGYGHVAVTPAYDSTKTPDTQPDLGSAVEIIRTHLDGLPMDVDPVGAEPFVTHGVDGCGPRKHNPRDGVVTIIAIADGEEAFTDVNGNGVYDGPGSATLADPKYAAYKLKGEPFVDLGEPFVDANDNGQYDVGEWFYDVNGNGKYDGPNGSWDGQTKIWTQTVVVYSGAADGPFDDGTGKQLGTRWMHSFASACTATPAPPAFLVVSEVKADPAAIPPVVGVAKKSDAYVAVASDLNLNFLSTTTSYAVSVDAPGKVIATYLGSKTYADLLGLDYVYWPCSGGVCANECIAPGACTMQPSVAGFSCGVSAGVTINPPDKADGPNTIEWSPFTTYPVYKGSHISTTSWQLSGNSN